jgi:phage tail protein X
MQAIAREHETLDELCMRHLGATRGVVEATLQRNRGLAGQGPHLPAGLAVELAEPDRAPTEPLINFWE